MAAATTVWEVVGAAGAVGWPSSWAMILRTSATTPAPWTTWMYTLYFVALPPPVS